MDAFIFGNREEYITMVNKFGTSKLLCSEIELCLLPCIILRATTEEIHYIHKVKPHALRNILRDLRYRSNMPNISNFIYLFAHYLIEQGIAFEQKPSFTGTHDHKGNCGKNKNRRKGYHYGK